MTDPHGKSTLKLSDEVLHELIELGRAGEERIPQSLLDEHVAWRTLVCGYAPWIDAGQRVADEDLPNLIRGLVLYSRASGRSIGGSVSPVIGLYRMAVARTPDLAPALTSWVVAHRTNDYEPTGRRGGGRWDKEQSEKRLREIAEKKRERDRRESTQRLPNAVRRGDLLAVRALLAKGPDLSQTLPDGGSLVTLAEKNGRDAVADLLRGRGIA